MKKTLLFVGFISLILAFSSCHPELTMDEILSQRPPYNARNVMEFRIPSAPNIENDVVIDFVAVPSTKVTDYGNKSCIDEAKKIIYIDMPTHIADSALIFKVVLGIGAHCEPASFTALNLKDSATLKVIAESGKTSEYKIIRLKKYVYTDSQIFTATIPNVVDKETGAPVKTSFMIGSNNGTWSKPYDASIYLPSTADSTKLLISLSLNTMTSYKASIYGPCSVDGPFGESLAVKDANKAYDISADGPAYDSTLVYSAYQVPVSYDIETGLGVSFKTGIMFRSISYSGTTYKYYRLRILKSATLDEKLLYIDPTTKVAAISRKKRN